MHLGRAGTTGLLITALVTGCRSSLRDYSYGPTLVRLSGVVVYEEHYGPPNFGENPQTDRRVVVPVLHLDRAIRVVSRPGDSINATIDSVTRVGVVGSFDPQALSNQHVTLEGTLFERQTADQVTAVMMRARRLISQR